MTLGYFLRPERRKGEIYGKKYDDPGLPFFSLRGDAFPAVISLLLLLAGDIELNPGPNCYACRKPIS